MAGQMVGPLNWLGQTFGQPRPAVEAGAGLGPGLLGRWPGAQPKQTANGLASHGWSWLAKGLA